MNNPNNMLIIESRSNYAFQLRGKNLSFSEIRNTSTAFFTSLPEDVRNELYNNMCHGTVKLDCEPELNAYMYAFGAMHNAKLKDAFSHLSTHFFNEREIDVIDYGCGQAMGCISYADYLRENNHTQNVRRITLIEPSEIALARAALHSSLLFPNAEIVTINKGFDDLIASDIEVDSNIPTLHIFSNVLDMGSTPNYNGVFNLGTFSNLVLEISKGYNEYVITEPLFSDFHRDEQTDIFTRSLGINVYYEKKCVAREFVADKDWTCVIKCGCIGLLCLKTLPETIETEWNIVEFSKLYGSPRLCTYKDKITGYTSKCLFFVDKSDETKRTLVRFSKKHRELSTAEIIKYKEKLTVRQLIDCEDLRYYELELDANIDLPQGKNEIWYKSSNGKPIKIIGTNRIPISIDVVFSYGLGLLNSDGSDNFGTKIKLNKIVGEKGIIRLDSDITTIRKSAFDEKYFYEARREFDSICHEENLDRIFKGFSSIYNSGNCPDESDEENNKRELRKKSCCDVLNYARLVSVTLPDSIITIEDEAFANCECLTSVNLGDNVITIGNKAFSNCRQLTNVVIPSNTNSIGKGAFEHCKHLTNITIPDNVQCVEENAFYGCTNLTDVIIGNNVTTIKNDAFRRCESLTSITIPNSVTFIEERVFWGCKRLMEFKGKFASVDGRCLIINGVLCSFAPAGLTEYTIPDNVTKIANGALYHCNILKSITIPNSVEVIGDEAFESCNRLIQFKGKFAEEKGKCLIVNNKLVAYAEALGTQFEYVIPNHVQAIHRNAFSNCRPIIIAPITKRETSIEMNEVIIYCKPEVPPVGIYLNQNGLKYKIFVPINVVKQYKTAQDWSKYSDYIIGYNFDQNKVPFREKIRIFLQNIIRHFKKSS